MTFLMRELHMINQDTRNFLLFQVYNKKKKKERNFKKCAKQVGNALETSGAFWRNNQIMTAYCIKVYFYKMNKKL